MDENFTCVYCDRKQLTPFAEEHVIPRGFGKFINDDNREVTITDRVCGACNNSFSSFEQSHAQNSLDTFHRAVAGIKGRHPNKPKPDAYKPDQRGRTPVILKGRRPGVAHDIIMRVDPVDGLVERTSAQFVHPKTMETFAIDLSPSMTREDLVQKLKKAGYDGGEVGVYARPNEVDWVNALISKDGQKLGEPPPPHVMNVWVDGGLRTPDFRSIAKVAFNYFMKLNPIGLAGHEKCFDQLRNFIRHGTGHALTFCGVKAATFATNEERAPGHVLIFNPAGDNQLEILLHLFASNEIKSPLHVVRLEPPLSESPNPTSGHCFRIEKGTNDSGRVLSLTGLR